MARNDRRKMIEFIASQMPDGEPVLVLAVGPDGPVSALVEVQGDDLSIASNCPAWVDVREVYDHLRWRAMPSWEQQKWLRGEISRTRLVALQQRLAHSDTAHNSAPYRFQKSGKKWIVQFTDGDVFETGIFDDHTGFRHYARLLANPDRRVLSLDLAGRTDLITSGIVAAESAFSRMPQHTPEAIETYQKALERLNGDHEGARLRGDITEMERVSDMIEKLKGLLWGEGKQTITRLHRLKTGGRSIPQKIHSSVGQAMRRAIDEMLDDSNDDRPMSKCAAFLERYVEPPDGESFIYRPPSPFPVWLL